MGAGGGENVVALVEAIRHDAVLDETATSC